MGVLDARPEEVHAADELVPAPHPEARHELAHLAGDAPEVVDDLVRGAREPMFVLTFFFPKRLADFGQTLRGSFSAASKPIVATKITK